MNKAMLSSTNDKFTFTLTQNPVTECEQKVVQADLEQLGLDSTVWLILNGTMETGTRYSIPKVLRMYRNNAELLGVAYIMECRRIFKNLLANPFLGSILDVVTFPIFFWIRDSVIVDTISNPGFVSTSISRDDFFTHAIMYLKERYLYGIVLDKANALTHSDCVAVPFCDHGIISLESHSCLDELLNQRKNLKKKVHKFANKGGSIEVIRGTLSPALCADAARCMTTLKPLLLLPFQDNYTTMAMKPCMSTSDRIVHFIARLHDDVIGYHSFACSGNNMYCLSGAFDRTRTTTYHAYENLILESIKFGFDIGIKNIYYGPILNPTKAKMMSAYGRCEQRHYFKWKLIKNAFPIVIKFSKAESKSFATYIGLDSVDHKLLEIDEKIMVSAVTNKVSSDRL
ncbi:MAG: hypothetical protein KME30_28455 [Iphinoe sp. HA4291-MV1]|jgi:hypothetical protein|nr:hypothetical protein [Iphinoe sp. HA4291-MV1]